jgi:hypothetical protein
MNQFLRKGETSMEKLKDDLTRAVVAAADAAEKVDDGGTCNLDAVIVPTGKNYPLKRMTKKLDGQPLIKSQQLREEILKTVRGVDYD